MTCSPSPVASKCWLDVDAAYPGRLTFLGIVGDQNHQTHISGHNCGLLQESPIDGVNYDDRFAHALDIGHGGNRALAAEIRGFLLKDPRVRYVIDNGIGYYSDIRGGGTFTSFDHEHHLHVSFMPGTTFDVRPFTFTSAPPTPIPIPDFREDDDMVIWRFKNLPDGVSKPPIGTAGTDRFHVPGGLVDEHKDAGVPVVVLDYKEASHKAFYEKQKALIPND